MNIHDYTLVANHTRIQPHARATQWPNFVLRKHPCVVGLGMAVCLEWARARCGFFVCLCVRVCFYFRRGCVVGLGVVVSE